MISWYFLARLTLYRSLVHGLRSKALALTYCTGCNLPVILYRQLWVPSNATIILLESAMVKFPQSCWRCIYPQRSQFNSLITATNIRNSDSILTCRDILCLRLSKWHPIDLLFDLWFIRSTAKLLSLLPQVHAQLRVNTPNTKEMRHIALSMICYRQLCNNTYWIKLCFHKRYLVNHDPTL